MCEQCRVPDVPVSVHIVNRDLEPEKAARFKAKGGRYTFAEDLLDGNAQDALRSGPPTAMWTPGDAWEHLFGEKEKCICRACKNRRWKELEAEAECEAHFQDYAYED